MHSGARNPHGDFFQIPPFLSQSSGSLLSITNFLSTPPYGFSWTLVLSSLPLLNCLVLLKQLPSSTPEVALLQWWVKLLHQLPRASSTSLLLHAQFSRTLPSLCKEGSCCPPVGVECGLLRNCSKTGLGCSAFSDAAKIPLKLFWWPMLHPHYYCKDCLSLVVELECAPVHSS